MLSTGLTLPELVDATGEPLAPPEREGPAWGLADRPTATTATSSTQGRPAPVAVDEEDTSPASVLGAVDADIP